MELALRLTPSAKGGVHKGGMHEGDVEGGKHEGGMHENDITNKGGVHEGGMHEGDTEGGVANDDNETNIDDDETNIADKGKAGKDACIRTKTASKDKVKSKTKTSHKSGDFGIVPEEEGVQHML